MKYPPPPSPQEQQQEQQEQDQQQQQQYNDFSHVPLLFSDLFLPQ